MTQTTADEERIVPPASKRALLQRLTMPWWTLIFPLLGVGAVLISLYKMGTPGLIAAALILMGCVLAAVHHAEVVAHRVGEPFGTLVLAVAVTVIEVSLIVSLMLSDAGDASTLARDTVFAAIMIILNGIVGLCLLSGGVRHGEQRFSLRGASASLNVLVAMVVLSLVLPNYVSSAPGPTYAPSQLIFVAIVSLILYGTFVFVQTGRHREMFLPADEDLPADAHTTADRRWVGAEALINQHNEVWASLLIPGNVPRVLSTDAVLAEWS